MDELVEIVEKIVRDGVPGDQSSRSIALAILTAISSSTTHRVVAVDQAALDAAKQLVGFMEDVPERHLSWVERRAAIVARALTASPKVTGNE